MLVFDHYHILGRFLKYPRLYHQISKISPLPLDEWLYAETLFEFRKCSKRELLISFNQMPDRHFLILEGVLRIFYTSTSGQEFTKTFLGPGDIASPYSEILQNIPSRVCIETLTNAEILELRLDKLGRLISRHPCWTALVSSLTERYFIFREDREHDLLVLSTKERYNKFVRQHPQLVSLIPQSMIASYLGVTPVSLSRILRGTKETC